MNNCCETQGPVDKPLINNPLQVIDGPNGKIVDFYLINEIRDIQDYIDFLREVENTKHDDLIKVHINCPGGAVDVALNIYDCLRRCQAQVVVSVEGLCASAASMIMLAGNEWYIYPHSTVMVHAWTSLEFGKWNELKASHEFETKVTEKRFRNLYKNFMTDEEIERCLKGQDFYFDNDEVFERIQRFQEDFMKKQQAIQEVTEKYQDIINKEIEVIINEPIDAGKTKKTKRGKKWVSK